MAFDPKCYELAEYFLADNGAATDDHKRDLAQVIQDAIEGLGGQEMEAGMKTITMMELRKSPGEYAFRVRADGESFLVTYQGKPCFKMVPVDDVTVIRPDGSIRGPKPITMGLDLGGEYASGYPS